MSIFSLIGPINTLQQFRVKIAFIILNNLIDLFSFFRPLLIDFYIGILTFLLITYSSLIIILKIFTYHL